MQPQVTKIRREMWVIDLSWKTAGAIALLSAITGIAAHAQTLTTLVNFNNVDGARPEIGPLVQGIDGDFYGTTAGLPTHDDFGTVFRMSPQGEVRRLHLFEQRGGQQPFNLIVAPNGMLYGTTFEGASSGCGDTGCGTVFQITPGGTLTTLHMFNGADGVQPYAGLVRTFDGMLYGTTAGIFTGSAGTVFRITPAGVFATVHIFQNADGAVPTGIIQATNGMLYGPKGCLDAPNRRDG
jgi:uncharacterized repeat protein (TIGR03803 family)